jgi:hypothetical protein
MHSIRWLTAACGASAAAFALAGNPAGHDHDAHPLEHLHEDERALLADQTSIAEHEALRNARRAMTLGIEPPTFRTGEEEHEHHLVDSGAAGAKQFAGPVYESKNTDGQAGSGPRGVAYKAGGRVLAGVTGPDGLIWRTGYGSWEPTLGVKKDGTVFFSARNTNVDPGVVRSRDGGRTWEEKTPAQHEVSLDPFVWVDQATGRVWANDIEASVTCPPLSFSDDDGETWTTSTVCGQFDHQSLFGGPPVTSTPTGYPNVVYYCAITGGALADSSTMTGCSRSRDGGLTFVPTASNPYGPREAPEGYTANPWCDGAAGHGAVDAQGVVYLARGWCLEPYLAISRDEGDTWEQIRLPGPKLAAGAHEANVAIDRAGIIYVTWVDDKRRVVVVRSSDRGKTFSDPVDVMPPGVSQGSLPNIDAGDAGRVALTFVASTSLPDAPDDGKTWNGYMVAGYGMDTPDPTFHATTINDPADPVWRGECGTLRCGNIGDFTDVVIAPDGTPIAAHVDSCPTDGGKTCTNFDVHLPRGEAVMGQLVGAPPLIGTIAEQTPAVTLPKPPAAPACRPSKPLRIKLRKPKRGRVASVEVFVNGKRVKRVRARSRALRSVMLRRLPAGRAVVRVVVRSTSGRKATRRSTYRTCG